MARRDRRPLHADKHLPPKPVMPIGKAVGEPLTPIEKVMAAVAKKDWHTALRLAKDLRSPLEEKDRETISRAWEALVRPDFFRQMNKDPKGLYGAGIVTLTKHFSWPIGWEDVTIVIPTVKEREAQLISLLKQIEEHCGSEEDGPIVIPIMRASNEQAKGTFPRALEFAANVSTRSWVLQLEDDVYLAPTFSFEALRRLSQACANRQIDVLTLFTRAQEDLVLLEKGEFFRKVAPKSFSMSQGFFVRREMVSGLRDFAHGWYIEHPEHNRAADLLFGAYLSSRKARVLATIPSLVQHRKGPSTLPNHHGARQSESYRRAYGEVP